MDSEEASRIQKALPRLIQFTKCNVELLSYLHSKNILATVDVDDISSHRTESEKVYKLFQILVTRRHAFPHLLDALTATNQTGALYLLQNPDSTVHHILEENESRLFQAQGHPPAHFLAEFKDTIKRKLEGEYSGVGKKVMCKYTGNPTLFNVRDPVPLFTGRRKELAELHNLLYDNCSSGKPYNVVLISGVSGIGKTEMVRKYVQEYRNEYHGNVLWMEGENEQTLTKSFKNLAKDKLGVSTRDANGTEKDVKSTVEDVFDYFRGTKCLFVYDNVDETTSDFGGESPNHFGTFLPSAATGGGSDSGKIHILLISQSHERSSEVSVLAVNELSETDSILFVRKGLGIQKEDSQLDHDITQLVTRLQNFPLAIQQAICYIQDQQELTPRYGPLEYLQEFENNASSLLDTAGGSKLFNDYLKTAYSAWNMTMSKIQKVSKVGDAVSHLLQLLAYITPDKIHLEETLLKMKRGGEPAEREVRECVLLLLKYCLVRRNPVESQDIAVTFSIHRLMQEIIRLDLRKNSLEPSVLDELLDLLEVIVDTGNNLNHSLCAWKYAIAHKTVLLKYPKIPALLTQKLVDEARFLEAESFSEMAADTMATALETEEHLDVLEIRLLTGDALMYQGRYDAAIDLTHKVIAVQNRVQCGDITFVAKSEKALAWLMVEKGRNVEAMAMFQRLYDKQIANLGKDHIDTVRTLCNIGSVLLMLGDFNEALKVYRESVDRKRAIDGPKGDAILTLFLHNVGFCLSELGDFEGAIETLQQVVKMQEEVLTKGHPNTILSRAVLASSFNAVGRQDEAWETVEKILELRPDILETEQPEEFSVNIIGRIVRDRGELERALKIHRKCYHHLAAVLGVNHEMTLLTKRDIARVLDRQGEGNVALNILKHVWEFLVPAIGEKHINVGKLELEIAGVLEKQGNFQDAFQVLEKASEKFGVLGEGNYYFGKCRKDMGRLQELIK